MGMVFGGTLLSGGTWAIYYPTRLPFEHVIVLPRSFVYRGHSLPISRAAACVGPSRAQMETQGDYVDLLNHVLPWRVKVRSKTICSVDDLIENPQKVRLFADPKLPGKITLPLI